MSVTAADRRVISPVGVVGLFLDDNDGMCFVQLVKCRSHGLGWCIIHCIAIS